MLAPDGFGNVVVEKWFLIRQLSAAREHPYLAAIGAFEGNIEAQALQFHAAKRRIGNFFGINIDFFAISRTDNRAKSGSPLTSGQIGGFQRLFPAWPQDANYPIMKVILRKCDRSQMTIYMA